MSLALRSRAKSIAWVCTLVYFASYLMRINFAVMLVKVCSDLQASKTDLAVVITGMTVAYGLGQVINGVVGDRVRPTTMLTGGLALAILSNLAMAACTGIGWMTAVWTVNGYAHSMLWPPIVRIMATYLNDREYAYAAVRVSWGSGFATILLYLLCPLLLTWMNWRTVMLVIAGVGGLILAAWCVLFPRLFSRAPENRLTAAEKPDEKPGEKKRLPHYVIASVVFIMAGIALQGALREGVTNWMPSYLAESFGISDESAIVDTVVLAIFSILSFSVADWLHRRLWTNELVCAGALFAMAGAGSLLLALVNRFFPSLVLSIVLMALIVACMHGINLMLISVVPKRFVAFGKVSTYSGLLNACTYVGASLATYGFAALAQTAGWTLTFLLWAALSLAGVTVCLPQKGRWLRFCREYFYNQ